MMRSAYSSKDDYTPDPCPVCGAIPHVDWIEIQISGRPDPLYTPGTHSCRNGLDDDHLTYYARRSKSCSAAERPPAVGAGQPTAAREVHAATVRGQQHTTDSAVQDARPWLATTRAGSYLTKRSHSSRLDVFALVVYGCLLGRGDFIAATLALFGAVLVSTYLGTRD